MEGIFGGWKLDETHTFNETWAEMERLYASGKARAIGVSNFSIKTYVFVNSWLYVLADLSSS
jgi:diketogulonate reductase-like aldo/keto reductase